MDKFKKFINNDENDSLIDKVIPSLSYTQRFYGFLVTVIIAVLFMLLACIGLMVGFLNLTGFALLYTFGNIFLLLATGFLVGFVKQMRGMFKGKRIIATVIFIGAIILTLLAAFLVKSGFLTLICVIVQICAYAWYAISYIPYARDAIKYSVRSCV